MNRWLGRFADRAARFHELAFHRGMPSILSKRCCPCRESRLSGTLFFYLFIFLPHFREDLKGKSLQTKTTETVPRCGMLGIFEMMADIRKNRRGILITRPFLSIFHPTTRDSSSHSNATVSLITERCRASWQGCSTSETLDSGDRSIGEPSAVRFLFPKPFRRSMRPFSTTGSFSFAANVRPKQKRNATKKRNGMPFPDFVFSINEGKSIFDLTLTQ